MHRQTTTKLKFTVKKKTKITKRPENNNRKRKRKALPPTQIV